MVKMTFSSKVIFSSGNSISGKIGEKNLTKSRRRTGVSNAIHYGIRNCLLNIQPLMVRLLQMEIFNYSRGKILDVQMVGHVPRASQRRR